MNAAHQQQPENVYHFTFLSELISVYKAVIRYNLTYSLPLEADLLDLMGLKHLAVEKALP